MTIIFVTTIISNYLFHYYSNFGSRVYKPDLHKSKYLNVKEYNP